MTLSLSNEGPTCDRWPPRGSCSIVKYTFGERPPLLKDCFLVALGQSLIASFTVFWTLFSSGSKSAPITTRVWYQIFRAPVWWASCTEIVPARIAHYLPSTWKSGYHTEYYVSTPEKEVAHLASSWQNLFAQMDIQLVLCDGATIKVGAWPLSKPMSPRLWNWISLPIIDFEHETDVPSLLLSDICRSEMNFYFYNKNTISAENPNLWTIKTTMGNEFFLFKLR